jgi:hypothetical protein
LGYRTGKIERFRHNHLARRVREVESNVVPEHRSIIVRGPTIMLRQPGTANRSADYAISVYLAPLPPQMGQRSGGVPISMWPQTGQR